MGINSGWGGEGNAKDIIISSTVAANSVNSIYFHRIFSQYIVILQEFPRTAMENRKDNCWPYNRSKGICFKENFRIQKF